MKSFGNNILGLYWYRTIYEPISLSCIPIISPSHRAIREYALYTSSPWYFPGLFVNTTQGMRKAAYLRPLKEELDGRVFSWFPPSLASRVFSNQCEVQLHDLLETLEERSHKHSFSRSVRRAAYKREEDRIKRNGQEKYFMCEMRRKDGSENRRGWEKNPPVIVWEMSAVFKKLRQINWKCAAMRCVLSGNGQV